MEPKERQYLQDGLTRLADGDREAFPAVYEALHPAVLRFVARLLPGADAEDAAQEALLKVFSRASEYDPARDPLAWALGVAAYEARTSRKRASRRREASGELPEQPGPHAEEAAVRRDLESCAAELLGALGPLDREALLALATGERPDVPGTTFRKRLERATARFRGLWRAKHGTE